MNDVMKRILFLLLVFTPAVAGADKVWNRGKGATWDCKKDPVVNINHGKGTYRFKGACSTLNVNGGKLKITAESIDVINVNGAKNAIMVGTVDTINVTGTNNSVTWKAAKSGAAPTVNNVGKDNLVAQAGGAPAKTPPATTPTQPQPTQPAAGAGIDCNKTPSHAIADNDRNLTFTGKCDRIDLAGNNISIKVESVKGLSVAGNENKATVDAADAISVTGNDNAVTYKKGISAAKPKVSNLGNDNKVSQVK